VQEALSNALRHSGSEVVLIKLSGEGGLLLAEVRDFGVGMGPGRADGGRAAAAGTAAGMGLRVMRYRADSIGARLEIRDLEPGVCVSCELGRRGGETWASE
jgi:signal transduction histidine kinase